MMGKTEHRSGYIAVLGRPNVGKSTLVNALVGHKISIVTSKPHTTRHAILGVLNEPHAQLIFIDTPGLETRSKRLLSRVMNKAVTGSVETADVVLLVVEGAVWGGGDKATLDVIRESSVPCMLVVNKVDRVRPRERLLPYLEEMANRFPFVEIVPVSAKKSDNLERLKGLLPDYLPVREPLYSADMVTDRGLRFRAAEILREKLMDALHQEVPYGVGVEINELHEKGGRIFIDAIIWVDRESHKGIVVGQGGKQIKHVGQAARLDLQAAIGCSVHLETHVRVKRNWSDSVQSLRQLGYDSEI